MSNAVALVNPSAHESLSIVCLEALIHKTPIIVNGASGAMKYICERSSGGLFYRSEAMFIGLMAWSMAHKEELAELGKQGAKFVSDQYNWTIAQEETFRHIN